MYMYSYVGNLNNMATLVGVIHDQISKHVILSSLMYIPPLVDIWSSFFVY